MNIHYELPLAAFLQFLLDCTKERKTGIMLFFSEAADWGKIVVNQGKVLSVRFKNLKGFEALPIIQELHLIQYHFRAEDSGHITLIRDNDINNEKFFGFFGITLNTPESIVAKAINSAVVTHSARLSVINNREAKILVADDSPTARKSISRVLIDAGYQVIEARNGFETLGQIENERPDLLLLDLIMPGIDGYAVIKAIGRTQRATRIPIIVLTSRDSLLDKLKGMTLSCDSYLIKPVDSNVLLETASKYLAKN